MDYWTEQAPGTFDGSHPERWEKASWFEALQAAAENDRLVACRANGGRAAIPGQGGDGWSPGWRVGNGLPKAKARAWIAEQLRPAPNPDDDDYYDKLYTDPRYNRSRT
jgi:hypothetical protein